MTTMNKRYAIVENNYVINIAVSEYPLADNWIKSETAEIWNKYIDGQFVVSDVQIEQQIANNKAMAQEMLSSTDWAATVDINNPQYSNPYLANQQEFLQFRSEVRAILVNTPAIINNWPVTPNAMWEYA